MKWKRALLSSVKAALTVAAALMTTMSQTGWTPAKWEDWSPVVVAALIKFIWKLAECIPDD